MIEKMTKYSFILLNREKEGFLEELSALGVMDISRSTKPIDERSAEMLSRAETLGRRIALLEKGEWKRDERYAALLEQQTEAERALAEREPWGDIDEEKTAALERSGIVFHYYIIPEKRFDPAWEEQYALQLVRQEEGKIWMVVAAPEGVTVDLPFKEAARPVISLEEAKGRIVSLAAAVKGRGFDLDRERETIPALKEEYASRKHELDLYWAEATGENAAEDHLTVYVGYAPTENDAELQEKLDSLGCFWLSSPATAEDNPPIKLKNRWFARQFEVLTGMYGMPVYDEFDPTPLLAPFFLLFFSMCMGDAGYGLLLIAVGLVLRKMKGGLAASWRLVTMLGVGTFFVGIVLGTFFGINLAEASWVPQWLKDCMITGEIAGFNAQMVLAIAVGVFHISLALVVKAIIFTRRFGFKETISTWGWVTLIVGGLIVGGFALAGVLDSDVTKIALIAVGVVAALGIFIFNKPGRNPLVNIGAGLWDTYGMVTGLMGDVLSYIRLFALGLAGGMLGSAFNTLASMTLGAHPTWQWLPFIIIALIGHTLNFAMACLGAFVHPLRLNFLEFFKNSGYEGKGTVYNPIIK
ncbi:MAG: ATPase V [Bacteroidales bacterium]|nr:ATPase V [Bacteroidales bacterium]